MPARPAHILVISITSCAPVARLRRPLDERAREGRSLLIFKRALGARQTHEAVRTAARGPAHPVDGSRPRSRAWRIFLNGESGGACAGVPVRLHAHVPAFPPPPSYADTVCRTLQAVICALLGATETCWMVLARLGLFFHLDRACFRVAYGLRRLLARYMIRQLFVSAVLRYRHVACSVDSRVHVGPR